jgi:ABC-2 type transport system permease protein
MSAASAVRLVAGREVRERGRSKVFWVGTTVLLVGVVAAIIVPAVLGHHGQQTFRVGTVGAAPPGLTSSVPADAAALGGTARVRALGSAAQARSALDTRALDLVIEGQTGVVVRGQNTGPAVAGLAQLVARDLAVQARLRAAGLPAEQIQRAFSAAPAPVRSLTPVTPGDEASRAIVVAGTIILYLALATYGGWVTSGVLEEKSSRVAEVILAAVRPRQLLAGKVIGIGLLALGQFAAVALTATIAAIASGRHLPASTLGAIGLIVLWFVLGYAFYCCAFAAAGAASSRQAEAPVAAGPLSLLILLGYVASLSVQSNPDGLLARITPFIPPLAPMTMPARMLLGHAQPWELAASVALMLATTYGLVRLAARAYSGNILRFGGRVTVRGMLRP